jgi:hypothetical protein
VAAQREDAEVAAQREDAEVAAPRGNEEVVTLREGVGEAKRKRENPGDAGDNFCV